MPLAKGGDANTTYFHKMANMHCPVNKIFRLIEGGVT